MPGSEDELIKWLAGALGPGARIGDDAALIQIAGRRFALSVDSQRTNVHVPPDLDPALVARRLLAVSLSDLAATGAEPRWALAAIGSDDPGAARRFLSALVRCCRDAGLELIGGDTARPSTPGQFDSSLTVIGEVPSGAAPLERSAARADEGLWIGGVLGESALGLELVRRGARIVGRRITLPSDLPTDLSRVGSRVVRRHLKPLPQLELGLRLGRRQPVGAAIDVSDGLANDLARLCRRSGVGCELDEEALIMKPDARRLARHLALSPIELSLGGGEDYALLFTLPPGTSVDYPGCRQIGRTTARRSLRLRSRDGKTKRLPAGGWDHLS